MNLFALLVVFSFLQPAYGFECTGDQCECATEGEFVDRNKFCDGTEDCSDSHDESDEICKFYCNDNASTIVERMQSGYPAQVCDGVEDCPNAADEANCEFTKLFTCGDGTVITQHQICDGANDCADGLDEFTCGKKCNVGCEKLTVEGSQEIIYAGESADGTTIKNDGTATVSCETCSTTIRITDDGTNDTISGTVFTCDDGQWKNFEPEKCIPGGTLEDCKNHLPQYANTTDYHWDMCIVLMKDKNLAWEDAKIECEKLCDGSLLHFTTDRRDYILGLFGVLQIIYRWGYHGEEHVAETKDGYLLTMHRIPYGKAGPGNGTRPVIYLQHGLEGASSNWVTNLPFESAGFLLADAGFDVWMGNFRGNTYGKRHISLNVKSKKFWEFSWDEMGQYDLEAMINKALEVSGQQQLYYMGHSEGTMTAFAKFSTDQEFAKKVKKFFALGPVATVGHITTGLLHFLAKFIKELDFLYRIAGKNQFAPSDELMKLLAKYVCGDVITDELLCENIMFLIGGANSHQLNATRIPVYVSHSPAGTSTQNMVHFAQMVNSDQFQMYDYGKKGNQDKYGQEIPPLYDLEKIQVPTYLFWGVLDALADPTDIKEHLIPKLKNLKGNFSYQEFNHLDFIWGLNAAAEVYEKVISIIKTDMP